MKILGELIGSVISLPPISSQLSQGRSNHPFSSESGLFIKQQSNLLMPTGIFPCTPE